MQSPEIGAPRWPSRLKELAAELRSSRNEPARSGPLSEAWLLLTASVSKYLRIHTTRLGKIPREDMEDIVSQKSLEILRQIELGTWDIPNKSHSEIRGFLSMVARNGLVDLLRMQGRRIEPADEETPEWDVAAEGRARLVRKMDPPDTLAERKEFAVALRVCAERLSPRARLIWFFRVFAGLSSKEIAAHPEVRVKSSHVDVLLQRSRQAIRECMSLKGHDPQDIPPGTFVELWKAFRLDESRLPETSQ